MTRFGMLLLALATCGTVAPTATRAAEPHVAHMVFFTLADQSAEAEQKLVAGCQKYLTGHEGTVYFSAGPRAKDLARDVNDLEFSVALHVVFKNKAAHDQYQTHPRHLEFIDQCQHLWSGVRVFDSYVAPPRKDSAIGRVPLPDPAAHFAGMIRGKVLGRLDGNRGVLLSVEEVPREWRHSRATDAKAMVGKRVVVDGPANGASPENPIAQFLLGLQTGQTVTLDVANKQGEHLTVLELTEEQRKKTR